MTEPGGQAAGEQPKKKSGCSGCALWFLAVWLIVIVGIVVSCSVNMAKPKAQDSPSAQPVATVDAAIVSKVQSACEAHLRAVAANSKKHFSGVPDRPYDLVSVDFLSDVKQVDLPHKEIAWEVTVRSTTKVADGSTSTSTEKCQYRNLQQDAQMLPL